MHREFVERRGWLDESEFAAALAVARIMPGVNIINLAVIIGQRMRGFAGAAAGFLGLLVGPGFAVIGLATLYLRYAEIIALDRTLEGVAVAAVGLILGMGVSSGSRIIGKAINSEDRTRQIGVTAVLGTIFVCVGVLHFPTVLTVLIVAPLSIALTVLTSKASAAG
jgi:chromate transporter